nr:MAG TPA: hypothetical protein [Caudoviricetes sp.]
MGYNTNAPRLPCSVVLSNLWARASTFRENPNPWVLFF